MPDYQCWPLWHEDEIGNVDPASLPITSELRGRLVRWAQQYNDTLVRDDPASSGFPSQDAEDAFEREGRALAVDLERELGNDASVRFWRDPG